MIQYNVELLDEFIFLQNEANDYQIRFVAHFNTTINSNQLKYAIKKSFEYVPILSCKIIKKGKKLFWEKIDPIHLENQYFKVIEDNTDLANLNILLQNRPDLSIGPQILITIYRVENKDILIMTINHMIMDGNGFKEYLSLVSSLYNNEIPELKEVGLNRNIYKVLKPVKKNCYKTHKQVEKKFNFLPKDKDPEKKAMLFIHRIEGNDFLKIQQYCKSNSYTINDYMIAGFVLALIDSGLFKQNHDSAITMMIDARRYDENKILSPYLNASSMENIQITVENQDRAMLLKEVHKKLSSIKENLPGYDNLRKLNYFHSILPKTIFNYLLKKSINKANISTTNLGILNNEKICFTTCKITEAYFITSLKKNNSIQFTFSSFNNTITITSFGLYSHQNIELINKLYRDIGKNTKPYPD